MLSADGIVNGQEMGPCAQPKGQRSQQCQGADKLFLLLPLHCDPAPSSQAARLGNGLWVNDEAMPSQGKGSPMPDRRLNQNVPLETE